MRALPISYLKPSSKDALQSKATVRLRYRRGRRERTCTSVPQAHYIVRLAVSHGCKACRFVNRTSRSFLARINWYWKYSLLRQASRGKHETTLVIVFRLYFLPSTAPPELQRDLVRYRGGTVFRVNHGPDIRSRLHHKMHAMENRSG